MIMTIAGILLCVFLLGTILAPVLGIVLGAFIGMLGIFSKLEPVLVRNK